MTASGHASGSAVVGITVATTILAGLAVVSRLITRLVVVRGGGRDDICISIAMVLSIALTVTMCQQVKYGMGRHIETLTAKDKMHLQEWFWASVWIYYSSLCFTKCSILLQYLRVFPSPGFRKACYALMAVIIAYSLATFLTSVLACIPVASFWDQSIKGSCVNLTAVWFTNASINITTDIFTAVLPIPTLKSLNLPKRQRYALMGVFALGGLTCIVSILRLQSLYVVSVSDDLTWDNPLAAIWSSTETNVGIICSCLPTLKGCLSRFFPRFFSSANSAPANSGREGRATVGSQPERRREDFHSIELSARTKPKGASKVEDYESDSLEELTSQRRPTTPCGTAVTTNYAVPVPAHDENVEPRSHYLARQPTKATSFYQVV